MRRVPGLRAGSAEGSGALIAAIAVALALGGCGQKGPLYLPAAQGGPPARASSAPGDASPSTPPAPSASAAGSGPLS